MGRAIEQTKTKRGKGTNLLAVTDSSGLPVAFTTEFASPHEVQDRDSLRESVLYPALDVVGIERKPRQHGFHLFRHTCGSIVYALTGDIRLAKDALAHSRISTTSDIYVHTDEVPAEFGVMGGA